MNNEDAISRAWLLNNPMLHTWKKKDLVEAIKSAPSVPPQVVQGRWVKVSTHMWERDEDGKIDVWAAEGGFHNGPICRVCGESPCVHCRPDWETLICRMGHYVCSVCGSESENGKENYCPNCGVKMDGGEDDEAG